MLDNLLTRVLACGTVTKETAYRLREQAYQDLRSILLTKHELALESLAEFSYDDLEIPT